MSPNEEEHIQMVVKNLLPSYLKHIFACYFSNFKDPDCCGYLN